MILLPIRDHNPSHAKSYITYGLILLNVAVYLVLRDGNNSAVYYNFGLVPARFHILWPAEAFTSMFLHGSLIHLGGNMLFLYIFGDNMEDTLGRARFLIYYFACGLIAGMFQVAADPDSMDPIIGASGAISGVMSGYLLLYPKARIDVLFSIIIYNKIFSIGAWLVLGFWIALDFLNAANTNPETDIVAYWAHCGGYFAGFLLILRHWLRLGGRKFWDKFDGHPKHSETGATPVFTQLPKVGRKK